MHHHEHSHIPVITITRRIQGTAIMALMCGVELILLHWSCYYHIPVVSLLVRASPTAQKPVKNDE